jgi:hypothetical protein
VPGNASNSRARTRSTARPKPRAVRLLAVSACVLTLAGCSSISSDFNHVKTDITSLKKLANGLPELEKKVGELQKLAQKIHVNPKELKGLHLTRPKGLTDGQWEADLKKDAESLEKFAQPSK